jgi:hypothetical protein
MSDWRFFFREFYRSLLVWAVVGFLLGCLFGSLI